MESLTEKQAITVSVAKSNIMTTVMDKDEFITAEMLSEMISTCTKGNFFLTVIPLLLYYF